MLPGGASASSRAGMFTPSPRRSPLGEDVVDIDADAVVDPPIRRRVRIRVRDPGLYRDGEAHRLDRGGRLDQAAVTGSVGDPAAMRLEERRDDLPPYRALVGEGAFLVRADEAGKPGDVGRQRCGELSLQRPFRPCALFARVHPTSRGEGNGAAALDNVMFPAPGRNDSLPAAPPGGDMETAALLVDLARLWLWAGAATALPFLLWGIDRVEPNARGSYAFRPLLLPAILLIWPLVLWRWLVLEAGQDDWSKRHRPPRRSHALAALLFAVAIPLLIGTGLTIRQAWPEGAPPVLLEPPAK